MNRIHDLRARMAERGIECFISMHMPAVRYLTGFTGSTAGLAITADTAHLLVDSRYTEQAADEVSGADPVQFDTNLPKSLGAHLNKLGIAHAAFEAAHTSVADRDAIAAELDGDLDAAGDLVDGLRMIKDADEVAAIRAAVELAEGIVTDLLGEIAEGMPEQDAGAWMIYEAYRRGGSGPSFPPIALFGARSSLPHGQPGSAPLSRGDIMLFDYGCILNGYCSDLTRTYAYGTISDSWFEEIYAVTLEAQLAALAALGPGIPCCDVDAAARDVIAGAGYGDHFGHATGHGVGIEVHEGPRLGKQGKEALAPGMVVTIEPGIYLPGKGGVRIEDMAVITPDGYELLTTLPKELKVIGT